MSYQQIAQELQAKGYPAPGGKGWTKGHVERLLKNPAYAGTNRWGVTGSGSYYSVQGEEVTVPNAATHKWRRKIVEDMIIVAGAHEGIISPDLFNRVNRNVQPGKKRRRTVNDALSPLRLAGLRAIATRTWLPTKERSKTEGTRSPQVSNLRLFKLRLLRANRHFEHHELRFGSPYAAEHFLGWLVQKLKETYLGPGRDALITKLPATEKRSTARKRAGIEKASGRIDPPSESLGYGNSDNRRAGTGRRIGNSQAGTGHNSNDTGAPRNWATERPLTWKPGNWPTNFRPRCKLRPKTRR